MMYLIVRLVGRGRVGRLVVGLVVSLVCGAIVGRVGKSDGKSDGKNSGENEELYYHTILQYKIVKRAFLLAVNSITQTSPELI